MKGNRRKHSQFGRAWLSLLVIVAMLTPMFSAISLAEEDEIASEALAASYEAEETENESEAYAEPDAEDTSDDWEEPSGEYESQEEAPEAASAEESQDEPEGESGETESSEPEAEPWQEETPEEQGDVELIPEEEQQKSDEPAGEESQQPEPNADAAVIVAVATPEDAVREVAAKPSRGDFAASLPETLSARLSDGTQTLVGVSWSCDDYKADYGLFTFRATLADADYRLGEGVKLPDVKLYVQYISEAQSSPIVYADTEKPARHAEDVAGELGWPDRVRVTVQGVEAVEQYVNVRWTCPDYDRRDAGVFEFAAELDGVDYILGKGVKLPTARLIVAHDDQFDLKVNENMTLTITGWNATHGDLVVPKTLCDLPVTAIGDRAFAGHDHMNSATLNDGLQSIGHKIFKDCEYLMFVELPDSLLEAEDDAFDGASDDMALILNVRGDTTLEKPDTFKGEGQRIRLPRAVDSIAVEKDGWLTVDCDYTLEAESLLGLSVMREGTLELLDGNTLTNKSFINVEGDFYNSGEVYGCYSGSALSGHIPGYITEHTGDEVCKVCGEEIPREAEETAQESIEENTEETTEENTEETPENTDVETAEPVNDGAIIVNYLDENGEPVETETEEAMLADAEKPSKTLTINYSRTRLSKTFDGTDKASVVLLEFTIDESTLVPEDVGKVVIHSVNAKYDSYEAGSQKVTISFELDQPEASCNYIAEDMVIDGTINPASYSSVDFHIADQDYTGYAITPKLHIKYKDYTLVEGYDYDINKLTNNIRIGNKTAEMIVDFKGNFTTGQRTEKFSIINKTDPRKLEIKYVGENPPSKIYDGKKDCDLLPAAFEITPYTIADDDQGKVKIAKVNATYDSEKVGTNRVVTCEFMMDTSEANPDHNYTVDAVTISRSSITAVDISEFNLDPIEDQEYSGEAIKPLGDLNYDGMPMTEGTDYTVEYTDNIYVGEATITITGKGSYTGTKVVHFNIVPCDIDTFGKIDPIPDQQYTGSAITPKITVKDNQKVLTEGTHYTVAYSNNTAVGTATVTVSGINDYKGTKTATFKIVNPADTRTDISTATIDAIPDQNYTGSAITPNVVVKVGENTLTKDTDYTVAYENNTEVGTATVTVNGTGSYMGTKTANFKIVKSAIDTGEWVGETNDDGTVTIVGWNGTGTEVTVPATYEGKPVRAIAEYTFDSPTLKKVTLPDGLTTLGNDVFAGCTALEEISLPDSLVNVDDGSFDEVPAAAEMTLRVSGATTLNAENAYTHGGTKVTLPNRIANIEVGGSGALTIDCDYTVENDGENPNHLTVATNGTATLNSGRELINKGELTVSDNFTNNGAVYSCYSESTVTGNVPGTYKAKGDHTDDNSDNICDKCGEDCSGREQVALTVTLKDSARSKLTKVYDRNVQTTLGVDDFTVTGVRGTDTVTLSRVNATFDDAAASNSRKVNVIFSLDQATANTYLYTAEKQSLDGVITRKDISTAEDIEVTYTGGKAVVKHGSYTMQETTEYTARVSTTSTGTTVTVTGAGNYTGTLTKTFGSGDHKLTVTCNKKPTKVYDGTTAITLSASDFTLSGVDPADTSKVAIQSVTGTYDNANVGTNHTVTAKITLSQNGATYNYTVDDLPITGCAITQLPITDSIVTVDKIADQAYDGNKKEPAVTVKVNGTTVSSDNYTLTYSNNINVGTAKVTITGKGNLSGSRDVEFNITGSGKTNKAVTITLISGHEPKKTYDGTANCGVYDSNKVYSPLLKTSDFNISGVESGDTVQISEDYLKTLKFDKKDAGDRTVAVNFTGHIAFTSSKYNYTVASGSVTSIKGTITPKTLTITPTAGQSKVYGAADPSYYKGSVAGLLSGDTVTGKIGRETGEDVKTYKYTVGTLSAGDNYTVTVKDETFAITAKPINATDITVAAISNQNYTGSPLTPGVTIKYGTRTLTSGTDYTLSYSNNTNAGTATVTITGKGNYSGTRTTSFRIIRTSSSSSSSSSGSSGSSSSGSTSTTTYSSTTGSTTGTVSTTASDSGAEIEVADIIEQTYDGTEKKPALNVTSGGTPLVEDMDYTVTWANNVDAGTANVTVTGAGPYAGARTVVNFTIVPKSIEALDVLVEDIGTYKYVGKAIQPPLTITFNEMKLHLGKDYTTEYSNNVEKGTATVTITGIGNYQGEITKEFKIADEGLLIDEEIEAAEAAEAEEYPEMRGELILQLDDEETGEVREVPVGYILFGEDNRPRPFEYETEEIEMPEEETTDEEAEEAADDETADEDADETAADETADEADPDAASDEITGDEAADETVDAEEEEPAKLRLTIMPLSRKDDNGVAINLESDMAREDYELQHLRLTPSQIEVLETENFAELVYQLENAELRVKLEDLTDEINLNPQTAENDEEWGDGTEPAEAEGETENIDETAEETEDTADETADETEAAEDGDLIEEVEEEEPEEPVDEADGLSIAPELVQVDTYVFTIDQVKPEQMSDRESEAIKPLASLLPMYRVDISAVNGPLEAILDDGEIEEEGIEPAAEPATTIDDIKPEPETTFYPVLGLLDKAEFRVNSDMTLPKHLIPEDAETVNEAGEEIDPAITNELPEGAQLLFVASDEEVADEEAVAFYPVKAVDLTAEADEDFEDLDEEAGDEEFIEDDEIDASDEEFVETGETDEAFEDTEATEETEETEAADETEETEATEETEETEEAEEAPAVTAEYVINDEANTAATDYARVLPDRSGLYTFVVELPEEEEEAPAEALSLNGTPAAEAPAAETPAETAQTQAPAAPQATPEPVPQVVEDPNPMYAYSRKSNAGDQHWLINTQAKTVEYFREDTNTYQIGDYTGSLMSGMLVTFRSPVTSTTTIKLKFQQTYKFALMDDNGSELLMEEDDVASVESIMSTKRH